MIRSQFQFSKPILSFETFVTQEQATQLQGYNFSLRKLYNKMELE